MSPRKPSLPVAPRQEASERLRVGFIGLGLMGLPMATNLLRAGFPMIVHSRSSPPVETLARIGARVAATPAALAAESDVVIAMVPTTEDFAHVLTGACGILVGLRPGALVVDMGTHDPGAMAGFASLVRARRAWFIDAPVSGGEVGARDATLSIMVGGPGRALGRARPVLNALGDRVVHIGDVGAGQIAKACNQLVVGSTIEAVAEALVLATSAGVDPGRVRDAMLGGFAWSRVLELHGKRMLDGDYVPGARTELHAKDARIVLDTARRHGVDLPGFQPVAERFQALVEQGDGKLDHSALVTLLDPESRAGLRAVVGRARQRAHELSSGGLGPADNPVRRPHKRSPTR